MLLREEAGHRAIDLVGVARPVRAGPELTVVEAGTRREEKGATGTRIDVVAGEISMELFPADEAIGMGEGHAETEEP